RLQRRDGGGENLAPAYVRGASTSLAPMHTASFASGNDSAGRACTAAGFLASMKRV
ncbi:unnamed protein product, partial [Mycena citricolor]